MPGKSLKSIQTIVNNLDPYADEANGLDNMTSCITDCQGFLGGGKPRRDPTSLQEAEKAITQELYDMTMEDREKALHDIHGVADEIVELDLLIDNSINELELELQKSCYSSEEAFHLAKSQSPDYVRGMYLMFLRCEDFHVKNAAGLMMRHFALKQKLFGVSKLGRDILLDDLNQNDIAALKAGFYQMLPYRDRAGRVIFVKVWYHETYKERENSWRSLWYITMVALQDEETQKKGQVAVIYNVGNTWQDMFDGELYKGIGEIKMALPMKNTAIHYCFSDPAFGAYVKFITTKTMARNPRIRARLHQGTHVETQYKLLTFGIPLSSFAVNPEGNIRAKDHLKWFKTRKKYEQLIQRPNGQLPPTVVGIPSNADVLFGRGKTYQFHVGNLKFGEALDEHSDRYFAAKRSIKMDIAGEIVVAMKKEGIRFLRQDDNGLWLEVDNSMAADKVSHGFRNRKALKKNDKTSSGTSNGVKSKTEKRSNTPSSTSAGSASSPDTVILTNDSNTTSRGTAKRIRYERNEQVQSPTELFSGENLAICNFD